MSDHTLPAVQDTPDEAEPVDRYGRGGDGLTAKQRLFVAEVLVDWNYTAAAKRAGYSEKSARDQGHENMQKPAIVAAIAKAMAVRSARTDINALWVLGKLASMEKDLAEASDIKDVAARRDRIRLIELIGKHVDVRAFRTQFGLATPEGEAVQDRWDLSRLDDEELETFERLLAKISLGGDDPSGEGEEDTGAPTGDPEE